MSTTKTLSAIAASIALTASMAIHAEPQVETFEISPVVMNFVVLGEAHGHHVHDDNTSCLNITSISVWRPEDFDTKTSLVGIRFGLAAPNGEDDWKILAKGEIYPFGFELTTKEKHHIPGTIVSCFQIPSDLDEKKYWTYMEMFVSEPDGSIGTTYSHTEEYSTLMNVPKGTMIGDEQ